MSFLCHTAENKRLDYIERLDALRDVIERQYDEAVKRNDFTNAELCQNSLAEVLCKQVTYDLSN